MCRPKDGKPGTRGWFTNAEWPGKEHDAVNLFNTGFLSKNVQPGAPSHSELASPQIPTVRPNSCRIS